MNLSESSSEKAYLQIAWNAATCSRGNERKLLSKRTVLLYDIPKLCQWMYTQDAMLLKTMATLLHGVSTIMQKKTCFLYEDSLQLYKKLQSCMALNVNTEHIDLKHPMISAKYITLTDTDDLIEFQESNTPFSDLMGRADIYADEEEMERDLLRFDILPEILLHEDTIGVNNEFITEVVDFGFDDMDVIFPQEDDVTTISSIEEGLSPGRNNPGSYVFPNTLNTADVPSLIFEESEEKEEIRLFKPRKLRRMMLSCQEDTVIPWDSYTQWDHLVSKQKKNKPNVWDSDFLILPSIAFNPFQNTKKIGLSGEEFAFFTLKRNRFHFPAPTTEVRRASSIHPSLPSSHSSVTGLNLRTSSDLTNTPDMHNLDLGDMDMQDAKTYREMPSFSFVDDFDYFDNDDGFQMETIEENYESLFLQELKMWLENGFTVNDLILSKDRSNASQCFYSLLELASKTIIRLYQTEPYGTIFISNK